MFSHIRFTRTVLMLCLGLTSVVSAQSGAFEGVVVYKMNGNGESVEMTQMYKGTKSRTEINSKGQTAAMIMDLSTGSMTTLIPAQKMYMVMDFRKMGQALRGAAPSKAEQGARTAGAQGQVPNIKATGRTEVVAGHTCEWYVMGEKGDTEVCSAKGLGFFMFGQSPMGGRGSSSMGALAALGANADYLKLFKDGFFPLKMTQDARGKNQVVMEATKVEQTSLDASLFVPPPDYTEMKMPGFGR
jgi:hypothetical protein